MTGLDAVRMGVVGGTVLGFITVSSLFLIWWERKISAHIQSRLGPMRVGWHGALQTVADAVKLLRKEDMVPAGADRITFWLAPFFAMVPSVMLFVTLPFAPQLVPADLSIGIVYVLAVGSLGVIGVFMAGWSSNNKYSLLGAMRTAAQIVSYEVPLVISVVTVAMVTGTLNLREIVERQALPYFLDPNLFVAFWIFLIAATAECNRTPFDIPEAESELVAGFHTEYSGMKFAMFFLAEYTNMVVVGALCAILFMGGWRGPLLPPLVWLLLKVYFIVFLIIWTRWTLPRFRVDQLMDFCWKFLVPVSLVNLAIAGARLL